MESYCSFSRKRNDHHRTHHDTEHGWPPISDDDLFRRLMLEISQAGLSFETILKRKEGIYGKFSKIAEVAKFKAADINKLMKSPAIIRNRLKIEAAVHNAKQIARIQKEHGSFENWLNMHHPLPLEDWTTLFRKNFRFTGRSIVNEFLMSAGFLPGAHDPDCPIYRKIQERLKGAKAAQRRLPKSAAAQLPQPLSGSR